VLRKFESILDPTAPPPTETPPEGILEFFWYFVRQAKGVFLAFLLVGVLVALIEISVPYFIGDLITILAHTPREKLWQEAWLPLSAMGFVVLIARPGINILHRMISNQAIVPPFTTLIRWQSHWHVSRQSVGFFHNDFAGRIANRVMQVGHALRETVVAAIRSVLHLITFGIGSAGLLAVQDWRLALPTMFWALGYAGLLWWMLPRQRQLSRIASEARSAVTGKVVDSYTNIVTVKLFAKAEEEDAHVKESMDVHNKAFLANQRLNTTFMALLMTLNGALIFISGALALWLWSIGKVEVGVVAMVLPLVAQIVNMAGWVAFEVQGMFENVGLVQESMLSISKPLTMQDRPASQVLEVPKGEIRFEKVRFGYGRARGVIEDFNLTIRPGEKVGLVGRSGAGKSTLVNLLLRFYEPESGRILIDGQNILGVTQESLRGAIGVVTQDTALLHRSIRENIVYGKRDATEAAMRAAADAANAAGFIPDLEDWHGRQGFDAHVGERGVKLSGGQRQRVAIARVILKNAPILVLDEATSALDSEVEMAIQESLTGLMAGKTVIAIAHRLSTLQIMDRLVILDAGRIVEQGSHAELLARRGLYADLWARQSGGFLAADGPAKVNAAAE